MAFSSVNSIVERQIGKQKIIIQFKKIKVGDRFEELGSPKER